MMQCPAFVLSFTILAFSSPIILCSDAESFPAVPPFHASINFMGRHRCSGAVVGENLVMTAVQCVVRVNIDYLEVAAGADKRQVHQVVHVIEHPLHDPLNQDYNFALVKVDVPFEFGDGVAPIYLSNADSLNETNTPTVALEWNKKMGEVQGRHVSVLNAGNYLGIEGTTSRMLCVEINGPMDDIGSLLVSEEQLLGILVKTEGSNRGTTVGVYSRVHPYADSFLRDKMDGDPIIDKVCGALRTIIAALKKMHYMPRFIRSGVEYLARLLHCDP